MERIRMGRYRHYKGGEYEVIGVGRHSETLEKLVVYRALYGSRELWVRPEHMWRQPVETAEGPKPRFKYICGRWRFQRRQNAAEKA